MIYNYNSGAPKAVTQKKAGQYFPQFHFEDNYTYFLYPKNRIICNYTLGLFFEWDGNDQYDEIQLPAILNPKGALIGCTQADASQLPTLYYQNGRLTLEHQSCRNIGWHPRRQGYHYIYGNLLTPNDPPVFANGTVFDIHQFNQAVAAVNAQNREDAQLVELYYDANHVIVSRHVSRSFLVPNLPHGFQLAAANEFTAANEFNPAYF